MSKNLSFNRHALAALFLSISAGTLAADDAPSTPLANEASTTITSSTSEQGFSVHPSMQDDATPYATGTYLAYVKGADETYNQLSQNGLLSLATELHKRTGIEPNGIVGIDPEVDDVSLFSFIYWPVSEETPRLSETAKQKIQNHKAKAGTTIFVNLVSSSSLSNSPTLPGVLNDLGSNPLEKIEDGQIWSQSFYIIDSPEGVFTETLDEERAAIDAPSILLSDDNYALAWQGSLVGAEMHEASIRFGINAVTATLMGTNKLDPAHLPTIDYKKNLRVEAKDRKAEQYRALALQ